MELVKHTNGTFEIENEDDLFWNHYGFTFLHNGSDLIGVQIDDCLSIPVSISVELLHFAIKEKQHNGIKDSSVETKTLALLDEIEDFCIDHYFTKIEPTDIGFFDVKHLQMQLHIFFANERKNLRAQLFNYKQQEEVAQ